MANNNNQESVKFKSHAKHIIVTLTPKKLHDLQNRQDTCKARTEKISMCVPGNNYQQDRTKKKI